MERLETTRLFTLEQSIAGELLAEYQYPWQALAHIRDFILKIGPTLDPRAYHSPQPGVWISNTAKIFPSAYIGGPCIIGPEAEVRQCAFIRGNAIVGEKAVVGNSTELKNVILFNNVQVPHFNYVGDSILGYRAHMGAGAVTSNVKSDKTLVSVKGDFGAIETGLKKFGAILGDFVEVGCNSVLNPGTVIGRRSNVYPTSCVRGFIPEESIFKAPGNIVKKESR
ncbi:MAG: UDP-N-acetylglucosamine pyrophosphorylase [Clostridiaceae bacterium]|nr:UDP-N-acetylglucosamine pyrophosphorylase [Clostridiaceae bacterium]MDD6273470.1 UDP-N-acetylglucosamine pyrophosphorylase [Clostridiaceae bacterium]